MTINRTSTSVHADSSSTWWLEEADIVSDRASIIYNLYFYDVDVVKARAKRNSKLTVSCILRNKYLLWSSAVS